MDSYQHRHIQELSSTLLVGEETKIYHCSVQSATSLTNECMIAGKSRSTPATPRGVNGTSSKSSGKNKYIMQGM